MRNSKNATIRVLGLNRQAAEFSALEDFANLGDSFEVFQAFILKHPTFWPVEFRKKDNPNEPLGWAHDGSFHQLTLAFRNYLRRVWHGEEGIHYKQVLMVLLGLATESVGAFVKFDRGDADFGVSLSLVEQAHPDYAFATPIIIADWNRGEFSYEPKNNFQKAVYALMCGSWRARACRECGKLFIADKSVQSYCNPACSNAAKRGRSLDYYHATGKARRERKAKSQRRRK